MKKHRNSQKRIYFEDACYFITSNTFNWYPFFKEPIFCDLFVENLRLCKRLKGFLLYGWVLGYDHFHLQIQPNDKWNISKIMQFLKRHVSRNINIVMSYQSAEGGIGQSRLRISGVLHYDENWLHVNKFDQCVHKLKNQFHQKYPNNHPFPQFRWHESFYDHYTRNDYDFFDKLEYIEYNPVKHGLPEDWEYVYTNPKYEDLADEF